MITLVQPYYNHKETFNNQMERWSRWSDRAKANIEILITDDHSKEHPLEIPDDTHGLDLKVLRVDDDILWNDTGADNLGIRESKYDWFIHCDFDLGLNFKEAEALLKLNFSDPLTAYWPRRWDARWPGDPKHTRPARNGFIMNKNTFWKAGGYDEDFCGNYGYSDSYFHDVCCEGLGLNKVVLDNVALETIGLSDSQIPGLCHDKKKTKNRPLYGHKLSGTIPQSFDHVRFKWHQVYP